MLLDTAIALLLQYQYLIMIPLIPIAQPIVGVATGVLIRSGFMEFPVAYPLLVGVTLLGDAAWYFVGYRYGERFAQKFGRFFDLSPEYSTFVQRIFTRYTGRVLLLSKVTNGCGFSIAVLFSAGMSRIPFRQYMFYNFIGECIWSAMMITLGYFFLGAYTYLQGIFGTVPIVILGVIGITLLYLASRVLLKRLETRVKKNDDA